MKVVRVTGANFRSYASPFDLDLGNPVTYLVGANNAGKSNLLELFRWLQSWFQRGQELRKIGDYIHFGGKKNQLSLSVDFEMDEDGRAGFLGALEALPSPQEAFKESALCRKLRLTLKLGSDGTVADETIGISNFDGSWLDIAWARKDDKTKQHAVSIADIQAHIREMGAPGNFKAKPKVIMNFGSPPSRPFAWDLPEGSPERKAVDALRAFVGRWHWLPPVRRATFRVSPGQVLLVAPDGANVIQVLNYYQTEDPFKYQQIATHLMNIVPDLKLIKAPPRGSEATAIALEEGNIETDITNFGTGLQQVLILVTALLTYPENSLVLLEEPEIHLHATSQRKLSELMKTLAKERGHQFLSTTHSTVFAQLDVSQTVYLVTKRGGDSKPTLARNTRELRLVKQLLGHDNTDLYGFNAVLVLEGETEEVAFPILAESQGVDFAKEGVRLLNLRGANKAKNIREVLEFLRESDTVPYVVLDEKPEVQKLIEDWVREGLVKAPNVTIWPGDFEDCFPSDVVVSAVLELATHQGVEVKIDVRALEEHRKAGKRTVGLLERAFHEAGGKDLEKPALGQLLAEHMVRTSKGAPVIEPQKLIHRISQAHGAKSVA